MPANAGRVPMPANNRLSVSDSLNTHQIWQNSVGHDPYAGAGDTGVGAGNALPEVGEINSSAKGLFRLAQLTGNSSTLAPGSCKRCGQVGHLYFQCRNFLIDKNNPNEQLVEQAEEDADSDIFDSETASSSSSSSCSSESDTDASSSSTQDKSSSSDSQPKKKKRKLDKDDKTKKAKKGTKRKKHKTKKAADKQKKRKKNNKDKKDKKKKKK